MSTDGWEQRLDDLGQARELREEIARTLFTTEHGEDASEVAWRAWEDDYHRLADALLSGPLAPLLAAQAAVERVRVEADQFDAEAEVREVRAQTYPPSGPWAIDHNRLVVRADTFRRSAARIRRTLDGPS